MQHSLTTGCGRTPAPRRSSCVANEGGAGKVEEPGGTTGRGAQAAQPGPALRPAAFNCRVGDPTDWVVQCTHADGDTEDTQISLSACALVSLSRAVAVSVWLQHDLSEAEWQQTRERPPQTQELTEEQQTSRSISAYGCGR